MTRAALICSTAFAILLVAVAPVTTNASEIEFGQTTSGQALPDSSKVPEGGSLANTFCGKDSNLGDFCFVSSICNPSFACTTNADCGSGERCLLDNCCGYSLCSTEAGFCSGGGYCGFYEPCTDCQEAVDQNQPSDTTNMAFFSQSDLAQSFQQKLPSLKSAEIFLRDEVGTQDSVTLSVYDGLPNAGGSLVTRGGTVAREGEWARVRFPRTWLATDQTYYMVLESGGSGGLAVSGDTLNPYPLGQVFANPGFNPFPDFDYTFRTFSEVPIMLDGFESNSIAAWGSNPQNRICSVSFDDAWEALGQPADPDTYYSPFGVSFNNINGYGLIGGEGNGDPGNWDIEGTYGSAAWGIWIGPHSISFASPVTMVSLDMLRGHNDYSITVDAYLGGGFVASQTVTLVGPHVSEPVQFMGPIDELVLGSTGVSGAGVDNIVYTGLADCP